MTIEFKATYASVAESVAGAVLVVGIDATDVDSTARLLRGDGHTVVVANSFEKARALLASNQPDLLITDIQLGAYNGLQLVWQRHFEQPGRPSIVTSSYPDPVLEAEARRLGCPYLVRPFHDHELLTVVGFHSGLIPARDSDADADNRLWLRMRVGPDLTVDMEPGLATMVDVSYGGCRLRFLDGADMSIASTIQVPIPTLDRVIEGTPVWKESGQPGQGDTYGVAVGGPLEAQRAWRQFVDAISAA